MSIEYHTDEQAYELFELFKMFLVRVSELMILDTVPLDYLTLANSTMSASTIVPFLHKRSKISTL